MAQLFKSYYLFVFFLFISCGASAKSLNPKVTATYAILMNADTGGVLYEKKGYGPIFPASTTKVATALYALRCGASLEMDMKGKKHLLGTLCEAKRLQGFDKYGLHVLEKNGTHMSIQVGEILPFKDLLYGLMVVSANDAANVMAEALCGDVSEFMRGTNQMLKEIGCENTQFLNPHGLYHEGHISTPYDMALIMRAGLADSTFRRLIGTSTYSVKPSNKSPSRLLVTHNRLMKPGKHYYSKLIGGKTGTLRKQGAGVCLVSAASHKGQELIAAVFQAKDPKTCYEDTKNLFEAGFNHKKVKRQILKAGVQPFQKKFQGGDRLLETWTKEPLDIEVFKDEQLETRLEIIWERERLPIRKGQCVGAIDVIGPQNTVLKTLPLYARYEVRPAFSHEASQAFGRVRSFFEAHTNGLGWGATGAIFGIFVLFKRKKKRSNH
jgi:serine-type D-Ala-D-Ala carboxypeptidase (penicillin-binding protein 5/6)